MELHIKERLVIPSLMPSQGTFMEYHLKKSILAKTAITDKDKELYEINFGKEKIVWNVQKDKETPLMVEFTEEEKQYLTKVIEQLSDTQKSDDVWEVAEQIYNQK